MSTITLADPARGVETPAQRLRRRAAAVRVHFVWWGIHRTLTAQQKEEVGDACGADARLLQAGKKIIDTRHPAFRQLTSIRNQIGRYWRGLTLPYVEPGIRLIRQSDVEPFAMTMAGYRDQLVEAEAELGTAFDQIHADARQRLGRLYDAADYPAEIRGLFHVEWDFPSVEPPSYLMRLSPEIYRQEQARVAARFEEAVQMAEQAFVAEFRQLVAHLAERLSASADGQRKVFRDTAVTNLTDFFDSFRELNVGSNGELDRLVEEAQQLVKGVTPESLRGDDALREHVATQLGQVQTVLDSLVVESPRRRIVRAPSSSGDSHATAD